MSQDVAVVWDDRFVRYNFGPQHPINPLRLDLTMRLAREFGLFDQGNVRVVEPPLADDPLLQLIHQPDYIEAVRRAGADPSRAQPRYGLGSDDNPCFAGMHEASARVAGGSVDGAERIWRGESDHAINIAGGLHHAMADHASGFCIYNDPAIAIARLLELGAQRVAYVDIDVHHGDGVQAAFWNDPRVLTISMHESGKSLFPGTGFEFETGGPDAPGSAINLPLTAGTSDEAWLAAFTSTVPAAVTDFAPDVLVTQHGCDAHFLDPLSDLMVSIDAMRSAYQQLHALAHSAAAGRWLVTGGGGYDIVDVVPRAWTALLAEVAGHPIDPETQLPPGWLDYVEKTYGRVPPARMTDLPPR
ncbi:MAG: acetoin utilization protein AcuC [Sporichthyaceae bacterium]|nr:acetoin utilization protein AcuC [Sporichthyaceae bacterium]